MTSFVGPGQLHVAAGQQPAGLRVVVIEGEDAVNIIQQKTAVAPVVEVRDRNDQPVAGAIVNFAIRSGRATFGGARTLSVTTNAAGRAIAASFAPTGSGALQISATAAFQGQTAAAVTIAQTTVQTAAQAAAVGSAGGAGGSSGGASASAGAGAGGGGGLSGTTLGIVGAAAGAGAFVAVRELTGGTKYSGSFRGTLHLRNPGSGCLDDQNQTGTLNITLSKDGDPIEGLAQIDGNVAVTPGTCVPDPFNTYHDTLGIDDVRVTGSPGNMIFSGSGSNNYQSAGGGSGVNSYEYSFTGGFDGTQIIGVLTITRNVTNSLNVGIFTGTVTYNVTLR
jgi:hypothetical protein